MPTNLDVRNSSTATKAAVKIRHGQVAIATVAIGAATLIAVGSGLPSAAGATDTHVTKVHLVATTKKSSRVPTGGADVDVDRNAAGKVLGSDTLNCRGTSQANIRCSFSVDLAGGDLLGVVTPNKDGGSGRVLAGTGKYAGYTGTIAAHDLSQVKTRIVITLHG